MSSKAEEPPTTALKDFYWCHRMGVGHKRWILSIKRYDMIHDNIIMVVSDSDGICSYSSRVTRIRLCVAGE